jgi:hypothetical protein
MRCLSTICKTEYLLDSPVPLLYPKSHRSSICALEEVFELSFSAQETLLTKRVNMREDVIFFHNATAEFRPEPEILLFVYISYRYLLTDTTCFTCHYHAPRWFNSSESKRVFPGRLVSRGKEKLQIIFHLYNFSTCYSKLVNQPLTSLPQGGAGGLSDRENTESCRVATELNPSNIFVSVMCIVMSRTLSFLTI